MGLFDTFKHQDSKKYVLWHRKLDAPIFDTQRRVHIYSKKRMFEFDYNKNPYIVWPILQNVIKLRPIDDIQIFYNTMFFHYGCPAVVIDNNEPESLRDKISIDFSHYDKSNPDHEVCNPEFKMCITLFNMFLESGKESVLQPLYDEYIDCLKSAELLVPFNPLDSSLLLSMNIYGSKKIIAYSSFAAIPDDLQKKGYTSAVKQSINELIEAAIEENIEIAIDYNSPGGGICLTYDDMFRIKGVLDVFHQAEHFRNSQEIDKAIPLYEQAANAGYNLAQNNLAVAYQNGTEKMAPDIGKAIYWYEKAAETFAPAAFVLGRIYDVGNYVPQDLQKAAEYYLKAANLGDSLAMYNLGTMYLNGEGVDKNTDKGIYYLKKAAEKGEPHAVSMLKSILR